MLSVEDLKAKRDPGLQIPRQVSTVAFHGREAGYGVVSRWASGSEGLDVESRLQPFYGVSEGQLGDFSSCGCLIQKVTRIILIS